MRPLNVKRHAQYDGFVRTENENQTRTTHAHAERDDIHNRAAPRWLTGGVDKRANPALDDESWALGNQLMNGPRLAPHRNAAELHGAARDSAENAAHDQLVRNRRAIRRGA
jgi:hypothetical protein